MDVPAEAGPPSRKRLDVRQTAAPTRTVCRADAARAGRAGSVSVAVSPVLGLLLLAQPRCTWMPARSRNSCSPRPKPCSASQRCSRCGSPAVDPARPVRGAVRPPCPARRRGTPLWHLHRDRRPDPDPQPTAHPAHSHRPVAAVAVDADNQPTARETEHRHRRTLEAVT